MDRIPDHMVRVSVIAHKKAIDEVDVLAKEMRFSRSRMMAVLTYISLAEVLGHTDFLDPHERILIDSVLMYLRRYQND